MINSAARFYNIAGNFTKEEQLVTACWDEIETAYNLPERHYHTLTHIEQMLDLLDEVKEACSDLVSLQLAVFYHDIVYDAQRNDNEVQSAAIARKRLTELGYEPVEKVVTLILATQKHESSGDTDRNYLLDTDLVILGAERSRYEAYARQVREEYRIYPDEVYNPGRVQVLQHFLYSARIFKTDYFYHKLEGAARFNLRNEIELLSGK
ncbi:MAG: hypothetical protein EOP54_05985 [Sphingobacteriales bacterium]|nr:MAG: hypothetical protein EOP54_05985 [Sphingobacteriales bacterium]